MSNSQGFWSYVQKDDEAEQGRLTRLAKDVLAQYEMLTGDSIGLFLDKDALEWGDKWLDKIDNTLASVAFFIPVLTPRYFMSSECRREFQFFARKAEQLGVKELVLPLHYVNVPALGDESVKDDLITLVRKFQWKDWRELRYLDVTAEAYRRGVSDLASRLVAANKHAEEANIAEASLQIESVAQDDGDDVPGLIDRMAGAEVALPGLADSLEGIGREIEVIGRVMQEATAEIGKHSDRGGKGFAHRLRVARQLAIQLNEPTDKILTIGNDFASMLHDVDEGFRVIIQLAPKEIQTSPESKEDLCRFFEAVMNLSTAAREGLGSAQGMIDAIAPIEKMSRDLRPVLRRLRQGLTVMVEARGITDGWVGLIESAGVNCRNLEYKEP